MAEKLLTAAYVARHGSLGQDPIQKLPHVLGRFLSLSECLCDAFQLMAGAGDRAGPVRVCRVGQTVPGIDLAPEVIELSFCPFSGRADVQAFSRGQLDPWGDEMQLMMAGMGMADPEDAVLVRIQTGEGELLEAVHDGPFHLWGDGLTRSEGQHAGGVAVLEGQRIDEAAGLVRIAPEDDGRTVLTARPVRTDEIGDRTMTGSPAMTGKADNHEARSRIYRCMAMRWLMT